MYEYITKRKEKQPFFSFLFLNFIKLFTKTNPSDHQKSCKPLDKREKVWYSMLCKLRETATLIDSEGYRSGHNEAVLKTVRAKAHKGSNPFPSAKFFYATDTFDSCSSSPNAEVLKW